ncbi:hypothetical protein [Massilia sp. Se16.2.3]|uniref:hypothetical protein n=1 Tax=Massilia sp. Se16.2.3 TaxID=2709303 RepID=UPI00160154F0|nr:hypothetical protein [Massilia sp. Se16.2.3]QNB00636.1 hypothetical protein G4G31_20500 [Massilia sp. Se16.2.3]
MAKTTAATTAASWISGFMMRSLPWMPAAPGACALEQPGLISMAARRSAWARTAANWRRALSWAIAWRAR